MRHFLSRSAAVAGGLGLLVAAPAWMLAMRERVTGPHRVEWRGPDDQPVAEPPESACDGVLMHDAFVHDGRLVVPCISPRLPTGLAWIDPGRGVAKIAWAAPPPIQYLHTEGLALRPDGSFGLVFLGRVGDDEVLTAAIAGRDGWLTAPVVLATTPAALRGGQMLLGMAWRGDALELVLTRPDGGEDSWGSGRPPEIVRLRPGRPVERAVHPVELGPGDSLTIALPGPTGWSLGISRGRDALLSDPGGAMSARPGGWWGDYGQQFRTDLAALGVIRIGTGPDDPIAEPDGTRHPIEAPPLPGLVPLISFERHQLVGGVLRTRRLWTRNQDDLDVMAQVVDDRVIVAASAAADEDLQLVGDRPDRLRPVIYNSSSYHFRIGAFLPAPGGYFWVSGKGAYVTLDRQLRRTDPLSLWHHLRTRGSVGDFIDEPEHVWLFGWALFGLPIMAAIGLLGSWGASRLARRARPPVIRVSPLALTLWLYAVSGAIALVRVLPLL